MFQPDVPHVQTDQWAAIAASLSVIASVAQGIYSKRRGQRKDPIIADIRREMKEMRQDVADRMDMLESKVDLALRGRSGPQRLLDDSHPPEEK